MPQNNFQRKMFALITVIFTVHAFVFYSLYVINGSLFMSITGKSSVISSINSLGGVSMCGKMVPIWVIIIVEFIIAFLAECLIGQPLSFKLACKNYDIKKTDPTTFENAVITYTVVVMVPLMSFIASWLYFPYIGGFNIFTLLANWLKLICFNFPFAYFSQLYFIQPLVRKIFKLIFIKK